MTDIKPATAAELAQRCLTAMEQQDNDAMAKLFHPDTRWELSYAMTGQSDGERTLHGKQVPRFHANMFRIVEANTFSDVSIEAISDEVALVICRSNAVLKTGDRYNNYYAVRATARDGMILHWLEFYDPRPAERVRDIMAAKLVEAATAEQPPRA